MVVANCGLVRMSMTHPVLNRFARRCTYCPEWASGFWGRKEEVEPIPPETGILYTCRGHWIRLYEEAQRAHDPEAIAQDERKHPGATHIDSRPFFQAGLNKLQLRDTRAPPPNSPIIRSVAKRESA